MEDLAVVRFASELFLAMTFGFVLGCIRICIEERRSGAVRFKVKPRDLIATETNMSRDDAFSAVLRGIMHSRYIIDDIDEAGGRIILSTPPKESFLYAVYFSTAGDSTLIEVGIQTKMDMSIPISEFMNRSQERCLNIVRASLIAWRSDSALTL